MGKGRQGERRRRGGKAANAANCGFESFALLLNYSCLPLVTLVFKTKTTKRSRGKMRMGRYNTLPGWSQPRGSAATDASDYSY